MEREYFYWIDSEGRLWHDGTELLEPRFLDFFFRRLRRNELGRHVEFPFLSECGKERNFVRSAERPIVFRKLERNGLLYAGTLHVAFDPGALRVSADARLWHPAPVGDLGLLGRRIVLELGDAIREQDGHYVLAWDGMAHAIRRAR